jgi:hypothetical protein
MLTKVDDSPLDKLSIRDEEIILNGPPGHMVGNVLFQNPLDIPLKIKRIPLHDVKKTRRGKTFSEYNPQLYINSRFDAGEQRLEPINLSLPYDTPPGHYEKLIQVGGKDRKVRLIVQPTIEIAVHPDEFTFQDSTPGTVHEAIMTVSNLGNLPFQIPEIKHVAALDMDYLCRAFGIAFREKDTDGFTATLDRATQNIKENLTNWADARVTEAGKILEPGSSMVVNLKITMPKNANAYNDHSGNVRFWDKDLSFVVKSHTNTVKSKKDAK